MDALKKTLTHIKVLIFNGKTSVKIARVRASQFAIETRWEKWTFFIVVVTRLMHLFM
jgi:hypothetical protein